MNKDPDHFDVDCIIFEDILHKFFLASPRPLVLLNNFHKRLCYERITTVNLGKLFIQARRFMVEHS